MFAVGFCRGLRKLGKLGRKSKKTGDEEKASAGELELVRRLVEIDVEEKMVARWDFWVWSLFYAGLGFVPMLMTAAIVMIRTKAEFCQLHYDGVGFGY